MGDKLGWYKITDNGKFIRYEHNYSSNYWNYHYYTYERVKGRRYTIEDIAERVKKILSDSLLPLSTIDLLKKCRDIEDDPLLMERTTFLKKLKIIQKEYDWLQFDIVGSAYVWYVKVIDDD